MYQDNGPVTAHTAVCVRSIQQVLYSVIDMKVISNMQLLALTLEKSALEQSLYRGNTEADADNQTWRWLDQQ